MSKSTPAASNKFWKGFWPSMAVLVVILGFLFRESFKPDIVHFSNDGPLGVMMSAALAVPEALTGFWMDLNWIGMNGGAASSSISYLLVWLLGPVGFAKFYPPIALLLLGAGAWIFFRTLKLSPGLCLVGAIAAALNMNFFSNTCWGLGTRALTLMSAFLALAALMNRRRGNQWLNAALAGLCVGLGVIEGADNGAIFSLFIAVFVVFQAFAEEPTLARKIVSCVRLGVVGLCAAFIAAQVLVTLTGIAAKTSRGAKAESAAAVPMSAEQKKAEEEKQWIFATMWSLPPNEMLRVIIPGLYGYRMDTPNGGEYWGDVGGNFAVPDAQKGQYDWRSSGAGEYAGVPIVLVGLWAVVHALRRRTGPTAIFDDKERRHVLFWAAMFIPAAVLAWGYHAPFYKLVFSLPYFSTIRNPMKFMHPGHMTLLILFGYGLLGLSRRCLETAQANVRSLGERFRNWRAKALPVERRWMIGSMLTALLGLFVFVAYSGARGKLTQHLANIGFSNPTDAAQIAGHSVNEVGLFAVVLAASVVVVSLIQIGVFSGERRGWAIVLLAVLVTIDLARADQPWIQPYNFKARYASNPVLDILRKEPWLHRASVFPVGLIQQQQAAQQIATAYSIAGRGPWLQWHYQYYNIQSIDMAQDPRPPSEKTNYLAHLSHNVTRLWELTNTRYIIGLAGGFVDSLNQSLDPVRRSFREVLPFSFKQDANFNIGADASPNGPWALLEFGAALPRAKLYTDWEVRTNDTTALEILGNPSVDVHKIVIVSDPVPPPGNSNAAPGTVEFASYAPKHIELKASATASSILLLNDQFDRDWSVTVNGQPAPLLRCNYIMRGVQVPAGASTVVFHFQPSLTGMKVTLAALGVGVLLCALLALSKPGLPEASTLPTAEPKKK
ncbi:MAG TPA: hypothetical protein VFT34_16895 [Verrucomicrobiae bacterium]|nr:hypothetical protein [Verrucomicrobiae bacterium]